MPVLRNENERRVASRARQAFDQCPVPLAENGLSSFRDVTLRLELGGLFLRGRDLGQFGALLPVGAEGRCRCRGRLTHPATQRALCKFQIPRTPEKPKHPAWSPT